MFTIARRIAFRELRGGLRGFRIFLACLALGVAAIGGAASLNESVKAGIASNAQPLLGGDLQARLSHRTANEEELSAMRRAGSVSYQLQLRSMARSAAEDGGRSLIELKAVDGAYPLYGVTEVEPAMPLADVLAVKDGVPGAAIDPSLLARLKIQIGDQIKIGEGTFQARAVITKEPDRLVAPTMSGPRVLIATTALPATELVQQGSLLQHIYNIRTEGRETADQLRERLTRDFPDAAWRLRGLNQAAQGIESFLDNVTLFLTLVGMTALLTGGIGVANAVSTYLAARMNTIATLKCLGAPARMIFMIYAIQIAALASIGIAIGLVIAAVVPPLALPFLAELLPVGGEIGIYPVALARAAVFGVLTAAVFALWPLAKARDIPPVALFRQALAGGGRPPLRYLVLLAILGAGLAGFAIATAENVKFAAQFVAGAAVALVLFRIAAVGVMRLAASLARGRGGFAAGKPTLRLALANLHRPGSPTTAVVLSLGLGLSVLVAIALLETNLDARITNGMPADAPSMFFIDIQPQQTEDFTSLVEQVPGVRKVTTASMIRGRITKINGVKAEDANIDPDVRWAIRGERGLSQSADPPENARIVDGTWWGPELGDEHLVSMDSVVAKGMGLKLGQTISVDVLGVEITAVIANLRDIRWQSGAMNFTLIFSPNAMAGAPQMYIATVNSDTGSEDRIEQAVMASMPNVTVIQVREALELLRNVLGSLSIAVRITASVALVAGALVLAGAIAAGHSRRIYEAVVLKVLGATRRDVTRAFLFEYGLLGLATGVIAAGVGTIAAWAIVTKIMRLEWTFDGLLTLEVIVACVVVTLLAGFSGTWRALGAKAAPLLRNE